MVRSSCSTRGKCRKSRPDREENYSDTVQRQNSVHTDPFMIAQYNICSVDIKKYPT